MADPVRYFFDQHMNPAVAAGLRRRGIDVLTAHEAGRCGFDDPDQLAFALLAGRVVVTFDSDYIVLHTSGVPHAGVVWSDADKYGIGGLIQMLTLVHGVYSADEMRGHIEFI